jgi:hypothetical protein
VLAFVGATNLATPIDNVRLSSPVDISHGSPNLTQNGSLVNPLLIFLPNVFPILSGFFLEFRVSRSF